MRRAMWSGETLEVTRADRIRVSVSSLDLAENIFSAVLFFRCVELKPLEFVALKFLYEREKPVYDGCFWLTLVYLSIVEGHSGGAQ